MYKKRTGNYRIVIALAVFLAFWMLFTYMKYEFQNIKVTNLELHSTDPLLEGIKIVYASDFQYDMHAEDPDSIEEETFQKAINMINEQKADIILLGGDYISYFSNEPHVAPYLQQLHAPLGVYGIFGNHDYRAEDNLIQLVDNIRFLENEAIRIPYNGTSLIVYGVEEFYFGDPHCESAYEGEEYQILLTHNPDFFETLTKEEKQNFDLTLAGHTHGGQITLFGKVGIPFVLSRVTDYGEKYRYGEKEYDGSRIYITSGLGGGLSHLPLRFGARPEIVVIE